MKQCNHRDINNNLTIRYDNAYEMRSSDMHCIQCGMHGSREDFKSGINEEEKIVEKHKIDKLKYVYIDTAYDREYISYPNISDITHKINEIIEYINKEK